MGPQNRHFFPLPSPGGSECSQGLEALTIAPSTNRDSQRTLRFHCEKHHFKKAERWVRKRQEVDLHAEMTSFFQKTLHLGFLCLLDAWFMGRAAPSLMVIKKKKTFHRYIGIRHSVKFPADSSRSFIWVRRWDKYATGFFWLHLRAWGN